MATDSSDIGPFDLPLLRSQLTDFGRTSFVVAMVEGRGLQGPRSTTFALQYCRIADKCVDSYSRTRDLLQGAHFAHDIGRVVRASSHIESSLAELHRAAGFLERIRALGHSTDDLAPLLPRPSASSILNPRVRARLKDLRDAVQHLDERVAKKKLTAPFPLPLLPLATHFRLLRFRVEYQQWAEWTDEVATAASYLIRADEVAPGLYRVMPE